MTTGSELTEDELVRLDALCGAWHEAEGLDPADVAQFAVEALEALSRLTAEVRLRDARIAELELERDQALHRVAELEGMHRVAVQSEVDRKRERDEARAHISRAGDGMNLLALLDRYHERAVAAESANTCTCDDFADSPCPRHARENQLQRERDEALAKLERVRTVCDKVESSAYPEGFIPAVDRILGLLGEALRGGDDGT